MKTSEPTRIEPTRSAILACLQEADLGVSSKPQLDQSDCYVFKDGRLITFNDEIRVMADSPLDFDAVVNADNLRTIIQRMPDEVISITKKGKEIVVKSGRCRAGISCVEDVALPYGVVPDAGKWAVMEKGVRSVLQQAARTCGKDETQYATTCVHVTPDRVEGCDNERLLRVDIKTGFPQEVLIPASSIEALEAVKFRKVSVGEGWVHFTTASGSIVSARCSHAKYLSGLEKALEMDKPENIRLPADLVTAAERAQVFNETAYDARISVRIKEGSLVIKSMKTGGWYEEEKDVKYAGRELEFDVNPKFLADLMGRVIDPEGKSRKVQVNDRKMKITVDAMQFVVALASPRSQEPEAPTKASKKSRDEEE